MIEVEALSCVFLKASMFAAIQNEVSAEVRAVFSSNLPNALVIIV